MPGIRLRRIRVAASEEAKEQVFVIVPSVVLPYMVGDTDDVEKVVVTHKLKSPLETDDSSRR